MYKEGVMPIQKVLCPARINLLGGWSDQESWRYMAVVVNAAIGWMTDDGRGPYPIVVHRDSKPEFLHDGMGTGLGVSSILAAGEFLLKRDGQDPDRRYIPHVLGWERDEGTRGGWQDQIGGVEPGVKVTVGYEHREFAIITLPKPAWWDHLVLFDTGVRRPAKEIGQQVRALMVDDDPKFVGALKLNVRDAAQVAKLHDPADFAHACISGWKRLCDVVPKMEVAPPNAGSPLIWGHMLVGAGGGGFGVQFVKNPSDRDAVVAELAAVGLWATKPILLDGVQYE